MARKTEEERATGRAGRAQARLERETTDQDRERGRVRAQRQEKAASPPAGQADRRRRQAPITFSVAETAEVLHLGRSSVYRMIERGELARLPSGRVAEEELRRFLEDAKARARAADAFVSPAERAAAAQAIGEDFQEVIAAQAARGRSGARPYHLPAASGEDDPELGETTFDEARAETSAARRRLGQAATAARNSSG